jgi:hypothetical protein
MRNANAYRSAGIAGFVLLAMPVLDVLLGGGPAGPLHAVVGTFALVLIAISAGPDPAR